MTPPSGAFSAPPRGSAASGPAQPDARRPLDAAALRRLRWSCRRGLLENDLFLERFFAHHGGALTVSQAQGLARLMELPDNDLLDLLLSRKEPHGTMDTLEVHEVLALLRARPDAGAPAPN